MSDKELFEELLEFFESGVRYERQRIIELLQRESSEWISKGEEDLRLVVLIKGENQ